MKTIKKNLLDLEFNKTVQLYNTTIILIFTFVIGVTVAFITKQIDYRDPIQMTLAGGIAIIVLCALAISIIRFKKHMELIINKIEKLGK